MTKQHQRTCSHLGDMHLNPVGGDELVRDFQNLPPRLIAQHKQSKHPRPIEPQDQYWFVVASRAALSRQHIRIQENGIPPVGKWIERHHHSFAQEPIIKEPNQPPPVSDIEPPDHKLIEQFCRQLANLGVSMA